MIVFKCKRRKEKKNEYVVPGVYVKEYWYDYDVKKTKPIIDNNTGKKVSYQYYYESEW